MNLLFNFQNNRIVFSKISGCISQKRNMFFANCLLSICFIFLFSSNVFGQNQSSCKPEPLPENSTERKINGSAVHCYKFDLEKRSFIQFNVEQKNINIVLRILDSNATELAKMDNPKMISGDEILSFIAENPGSFTLEIKCVNENVCEGRYLLKSSKTRTAAAADGEKVQVEKLFITATMDVLEDKYEEALAKLNAGLQTAEKLKERNLIELLSNQRKRIQGIKSFLEAQQLGGTGNLESLKQAKEKYIAAVKMFEQLNMEDSETLSVHGLGVTLYSLGEKKEALENFKKALKFYLKVKSSSAIGILDGIVSISFEIDDLDSALEHLLILQSYFEKMPDKKVEEANVDNDIGTIYYKQKNYKIAFEYYKKALEIRKTLPNKCGLAATLSNASLILPALEQKRLANEYIKDAAEIVQNTKECSFEKAAVLINIGKTYNNLFENELAIKYLEEASKNISPEQPVKFAEIQKASISNNLGESYLSLGLRNKEMGQEKKAVEFIDKALKFFNDSLTISTQIDDKPNTALSLNNIGLSLAASGRNDEALKFLLEKSLIYSEKIWDTTNQAAALNTIGEIYVKEGDHRKALNYYIKAIKLFRISKDESGEAQALGNAMIASDLDNNKKLAIFFGKTSVNLFQNLRKAAKVYDSEIQRSYLKSIRSYYKILASIFFNKGDYDETIQILNLFQDQQIYDLTADAGKIRDILLSEDERRFKEQFEKLLNNTDADQQLFDFPFSSGSFSGNEGTTRKISFTREEITNDSLEMKQSLAFLNSKGKGKKHAAIYTFITQDQLNILLITPEKDIKNLFVPIKAFTYPIKAIELNKQVLRFLTTLKNSAYDPYEEGSKIYENIFQAVSTKDSKTTLETALADYKPNVLHWALDGTLRYIPIAALSDKNKRFVVEKYETAVFTRADKNSFIREPQKWTSCLGLGTTEEHGRFAALSGVKDEAEKLCNPQSKIIKGKFLLNDEFNLSTIENLNAGSKPPLVHIATHLKFEPGDAQSSFLLLGDGKPFSLYDMQKYPNLFKGVDLVTAAACDAGNLEADDNGREIDAFAELTQRTGAASVIATLWKIDDTGTSQLMIDFYSLYIQEIKKDPDNIPTKSGILRRSQLNLMKVKGKDCGGNNRSDFEGKTEKGYKMRDPNDPCRHPYFWSPFVLYGSPR